jgi:ribose 5-phosphate isomerase B
MTTTDKVLVVGSDHAGFPLKADLVALCREEGWEIIDVGSYDPGPADFPDITRAACERILSGQASRGLMVCGTGVGASIAANKIPGIRASICHDAHCARQCVEHDDVNVMCIGAKIVGPWLARDLLRIFLNAKFNATEDHVRRVAKLHAMDARKA